jgi:hypothetical protein
MSQPTAEDRMDRAALAAVVIFILVCCAALGAVIFASARFLLQPLDHPDVRSTFPTTRPSLTWTVPLRAPARPAE